VAAPSSIGQDELSNSNDNQVILPKGSNNNVLYQKKENPANYRMSVKNAPVATPLPII